MVKYIFVVSLAVASPALAAERTLSLTDFDRIHVEGGFIVDVRTGAATTGRIIGSQAAIDVASVEVQGRQLTIRRDRSVWGRDADHEPPAATIRLTLPALSNIWVSGPAKVSVDRLKGLRVAASLEGPGALSVGGVAADRMDVGVVGAGTLSLAGAAATLTATVRGAGTFDGAKLVVTDLKLTSESAGQVTLAVKRAANITMTGTGAVTIVGSPACTVKNVGSGTVRCGSDQPQR